MKKSGKVVTDTSSALGAEALSHSMRYYHVGQGQSGDEAQRRREELLYPRKIEVEREGQKPEESECGNNGEIQRNSDPTRGEHLATQLKVLPRVPAYEPYRESSERRKDDPSDETQESLQGFRAVIPSLLERVQKRYRHDRGDDVRDGLQVRGDAREDILRYEVPHVVRNLLVSKIHEPR